MKRSGYTLVELLISVAALVVVFGGLSCTGCAGFKGLTKSDGFRDGTLQKLTTKGIVFHTHEGELATSGIKSLGSSGGVGNTFEFSVWEDSIMEDMQEIPAGKVIRIHYRQHRFVGPWTGSTAYEVYKYDIVE